MIRTIIFDIGNVLTVFGWKNFLKSFGFDAETEEKVAKATMDNPFWNEFDRGMLNEEEMLADSSATTRPWKRRFVRFMRICTAS